MRRILIVDDEEDIRNVLRMRLGKKGFTVDIADGAAQASEKLKANSYDLIISDYRMGDGTGLDVLKEVNEKVPFIMISGYSDVEKDDLLKQRPLTFLHKPVKFEVLLENVNQLVK